MISLNMGVLDIHRHTMLGSNHGCSHRETLSAATISSGDAEAERTMTAARILMESFMVVM